MIETDAGEKARVARMATEKADEALQQANAMAFAGLGVAVRHFRQLRGWSIPKVAEAADIHEGTLAKLERGEHSPTFRTLISVCNVLNVDIVELLVIARRADPKEGIIG